MALKAFLHKNTIEAGVDEVGRGCLAGPVVAAAVILPPNFKNNILNDSKKLSDKKRRELVPIIKDEAIAWSISEVSPEKIDEINILNASILAMHHSLDKLQTKFEHILVDGNKFHAYHDMPHTCVIKGDSHFFSIAAASVLAKTYRDDLMIQLHDEHPYFDWHKNAGYPTKAHRKGISEYGVTPYHRNSFKLLPEQLSLSLE